MHIHFLDPYFDGKSTVHGLDARVKFILIIGFIITTALTGTAKWPVFILLTALVISAEVLSEVSLKYYLKRSLLALPFVLAALPVLFTGGGEVIISLPFHLQVTVEGLAKFISITWKSWISVQAAILLSATTRFPDILSAMRFVHLPRLLVSIIGLMWRYLFVMADETLRLIRARQSRSAISINPAYRTGGTLAWRARVTGGMAGSLFLRSLERSDRIYLAMVSRGYDGEIRTLPQPKIAPGGWLTISTGIIFYGLILLFGNLL
jgi:cobalt/nickel transport system permease protein